MSSDLVTTSKTKLPNKNQFLPKQASDLLELPPVKILCKHDGEEYGNDYSDDDDDEL